MSPLVDGRPNQLMDLALDMPTFSRSKRRWLRFSLLLLGWIVVRGVFEWRKSRLADTNVDRLVEGNYRVDHVYSLFEMQVSRPGDSERARIRLLGLRKPWQWERDSDRWSREGRKYVESLTGRSAESQVRIRIGRQQVTDDGSLLAYVYVGDELLNERLVRDGWVLANPSADPSNSLMRGMKRAEDAARQEAVGIWSAQALGMLGEISQ